MDLLNSQPQLIISKSSNRSLCGKGSHSKVWKYDFISEEAVQPSNNTFNNNNKDHVIFKDKPILQEIPSCIAVKEISLLNLHTSTIALRELTILKHINHQDWPKGQNHQRQKDENEINKQTATRHSFLFIYDVVLFDPLKDSVHIICEYSHLGTLSDWLKKRWSLMRDDELQQILRFIHDPAQLVSSSSLDTHMILLSSHLSMVSSLIRQFTTILYQLHHLMGISHGDLKPTNFLLFPSHHQQHRHDSDYHGSDSAHSAHSSSDHTGNPFGENMLRLVITDFGLSTKLTSLPSTISLSEHLPQAQARISNQNGNNKRPPSSFSSSSSAASAPPSFVVPLASCGTNWYCSPEAFHTQRTELCEGDVWSLGVMVWEVLAFGRHPVKHALSLKVEQSSTPTKDDDDVSTSSLRTDRRDRREIREISNDNLKQAEDRGDKNQKGGVFEGGDLSCQGDMFWDIFEVIETLPQHVPQNVPTNIKKQPMKNHLKNAVESCEGISMQLNEVWEFIESCLKIDKMERRAMIGTN